jgi:hypothetical protein
MGRDARANVTNRRHLAGSKVGGEAREKFGCKKRERIWGWNRRIYPFGYFVSVFKYITSK